MRSLVLLGLVSAMIFLVPDLVLAASWSVPGDTAWSTTGMANTTLYQNRVMMDNNTQTIDIDYRINYTKATQEGFCTKDSSAFYCTQFNKAIIPYTKGNITFTDINLTVDGTGYGVQIDWDDDECAQYISNIRFNGNLKQEKYYPWGAAPAEWGCSNNNEIGKCDSSCSQTNWKTLYLGNIGTMPGIYGNNSLWLSFSNAREDPGKCSNRACAQYNKCYEHEIDDDSCDEENDYWVQVNGTYKTINLVQSNYVMTKDFGKSVDLTELFVSTEYLDTTSNITVKVSVSDDAGFVGYVEKELNLTGGGNTFRDQIMSLPSKRFLRLNFTFNPSSDKMVSPVLMSFRINYMQDTLSPQTSVSPATGVFSDDVSYTLTCTDQTDGDPSGCNQTYQLLTALESCSPAIGAHWDFNETDVVQEPFNDLDGVYTGNAKMEISVTNRDKVAYLNGASGSSIKVADSPYMGQENNPFLNGYGDGVEFTAELWIMPDEIPTEDYDVLLSKWGNGIGEFQILLNSAGRVKVVIGSNETSDNTFKTDEIVSASDIPSDAWSFIVFTFKTGNIKLYINGQLAASKTSSLINRLQDGVYQNDDLYFGADNAGAHVFKGWIDDVIVYKNALTDSQIAEHFAGKGAWKLGTSGRTSCGVGQACVLRLCAYSKDNNDNSETSSVKATYTISRSGVDCTMAMPSQVGNTFNVTVGIELAGVQDLDIIWSSQQSMASPAYLQCTPPSSGFAGNYSCTGLPNGTSYLACSIKTAAGVTNGTGRVINVDIGRPTCTVAAEVVSTGVNVTCACSDPGSGIRSIECAVKEGSSYFSLADKGCSVPAMACSGTCIVEASCGSNMTGKDFYARSTDMLGNIGDWRNESISPTDEDGDGFSTNDCDDDNDDVYPGAKERCDEVDNDCDGQVDEDWTPAPWNLGDSCDAGCAGVMACNSTRDGTYCLADCGCVDGTKRACGTDAGICVKGNQTCNNGEWGSCIGGVEAENEICDNELDDDCDGTVDEYSCKCKDGDTKECGSNIGECQSGQMACIDGEWGDCIGSLTPVTEVCDNGLDDDCDGDEDEADCSDPNEDTCSNGEQDDDEEGVDCGGSCQACQAPIEIWVVVAAVCIIVVIVLGLVVAMSKGKAAAAAQASVPATAPMSNS